MKIALIGATGNVGSRVLKEALQRGHQVTGIVRHPDKLPTHKNLKSIKADIKDTEAMTKALAGHDIIISAVHYTDFDAPTLLNEIKKSGVKRYMLMGGAGSLEVKPGLQLADSPDLPQEYKLEASLGRDYLNLLRKEKEVQWTVLSPQLMLVPGERTGKFRIGTDQLLFNKDGQSIISMEDVAYAMMDEIENPKFIQKRFTVGY
jgi:uncharacterized protein